MFSFYKDPEIFQCCCAFRINLFVFLCFCLSACSVSGCGCGNQRPASFLVASHFFETESLSNPRTHLYGQMTGEPKGSSCFCLLSVRIKGANTTD